jgi:hypothetical protein
VARPAEQPVERRAEPPAGPPAEPSAEPAVERAAPAPAPAPEVEDDTATDPLEHAGAAMDTRATDKADEREPRADRAEARARRREQKREAKLEAKREKEERALKKWELAPAEALVARLPAIKPLYAAIISGTLSGMAAVLLAIGASSGCEAVRDTSNCGGGVGLLATVALLAIEVMIGANLLKAWQISDPVSTSFLGVGVVATIAMLAFLDDIDSPWMLLVIPLMTAAAFALSWWVTVRFVDEHPMTSEIDSEHGEPDFIHKPADVSEDEDSNR